MCHNSLRRLSVGRFLRNRLPAPDLPGLYSLHLNSDSTERPRRNTPATSFSHRDRRQTLKSDRPLALHTAAGFGETRLHSAARPVCVLACSIAVRCTFAVAADASQSNRRAFDVRPATHLGTRRCCHAHVCGSGTRRNAGWQPVDVPQ